MWWVGGYALGIAMPPNWVGHTYLANDAFEQFTLGAGLRHQLREHPVRPRRVLHRVSYMETLLMGPERIETLSALPRTLTVLSG